jgi:hypothetical protein
MKYIITENRLANVIQIFVDKFEKPEGLCKVWVDYDELNDSISVNLFFDRSYSKKRGWDINHDINTTKRYYGLKIMKTFGRMPVFYQHFDDCSELTSDEI